MTIHQFPEGKALKNILDERREELSELYDTLNRAYQLAHTIEERADGLENEYNYYLRRYSQAVGGIENVEVGLLEYGSEISIDADEGTIVFTPWSEEDETEV